MSRAFVGNRVQNVDIGENLKAITRVIIVADSGHVYVAGDDSGRTIKKECPWGTQEMADALLEKLSNVSYQPFSAERAMLSPAFEIGDAVTVGGAYSQIIGADINYGVSGLVDIYAPDLDEVEDEFPSEKTTDSSIQRKLEGVRSYITKTAEQIRMEVSKLETDLDGRITEANSSITQTAESIRQEIEKLETDLDGRITEANSSITQTAESIRTEVGETIGNLGEYSSVSSMIEQTASSIRDEISGFVDGDYVSNSITTALDGLALEASSANGTTVLKLMGGEAVLSTKELKLSVDAANITGKLVIGQQLPENLATKNDIPDVSEFATFDDIPDVSSFLTSSDLGENGRTTIWGGLIETDSLYADSLHLGGLLNVYKTSWGSALGGFIGYDSGFLGASGIGMRDPEEMSQVVCTAAAARISYGNLWGISQVNCAPDSVTVEGRTIIQFKTFGVVRADIDEEGFYPADLTLTLGTTTLPWADVYAAGTSMSNLLARVEALEGK